MQRRLSSNLRRINLRRLYRMHSDPTRRALQIRGRHGLLTLQQQTPLLLQETCAFAAQLLALIPVADGSKMLSRRKDETTREHKPAKEQ